MPKSRSGLGLTIRSRLTDVGSHTSENHSSPLSHSPFTKTANGTTNMTKSKNVTSSGESSHKQMLALVL